MIAFCTRDLGFRTRYNNLTTSTASLGFEWWNLVFVITSHRKITSNEIFFTTIHHLSCWEQLFGEHVSHCVEGKVTKSKNVTNIFFFIQHINEEAIHAKPVNLVNLGLVKESFRYYFMGSSLLTSLCLWEEINVHFQMINHALLDTSHILMADALPTKTVIFI